MNGNARQRGGFAMGVVVGLLVGLTIALAVALYITKAPMPFVNKVPQRTAEQDQAEQAKNRNWDPNAPLATKPANRPQVPSPASAAAVLAGPAGAASAPASAPGKATRDPAAILSGALTPGAPRAASGAAPAVAAAPAAVPKASAPKPAASAATPAPPRPAIADGGTGARALPADGPTGAYVLFVQTGAWGRAEEAENQRAKLALMGHTARVTEREQNGRVMYRVRVGPFDNRNDADALQERFRQSGIDSQLIRVERSPQGN